MPYFGCFMKGGITILIASVEARPSFDKYGNTFNLTGRGGIMKRRVSRNIGLVDVYARRKKPSELLVITAFGGNMKRVLEDEHDETESKNKKYAGRR